MSALAEAVPVHAQDIPAEVQAHVDAIQHLLGIRIASGSLTIHVNDQLVTNYEARLCGRRRPAPQKPVVRRPGSVHT